MTANSFEAPDAICTHFLAPFNFQVHAVRPERNRLGYSIFSNFVTSSGEKQDPDCLRNQN